MADINRFMVPAEIPQPSFFQLPYEQMKQGLLVAQQQQDQARAGLDAIGNVQFNYLTNPEDVKLANETYGYIDKGIEGIIAKQGNGDLRGLRNDIGTHAKNVSKLFRPDQVVGKLQSNYAAFNDWYKKQLDNKDLDPTYVNQAAETFMNAYDKKGGARAGSISTENLVPFFDSSKFVNDNKDMIKSTLVQRERDILGGNGYKYTDEQLLKQIPPERVKQTLTEILMSNPDYNSSLAQRVRLGNLGQESIPLLLEPRDSGLKDIDGKPIMISDLNPYNPSASAIHGAMVGLGVVEEDRKRHSIGTDEPWFKFWTRANEVADKEELPLLPTTEDYSLNSADFQGDVNKMQQTYNGSPTQTSEMLNLMDPIKQTILNTVYEVKNGKKLLKPEWKEIVSNTKSVDGTTIPEEVMINMMTLSHNDPVNGGDDVYFNEGVAKKYLESQGYRTEHTFKKDGFWKGLKSLYTGYLGAETDIPNISTGLDQDHLYGMPTFNIMKDKNIRTLQNNLKETYNSMKNVTPKTAQGISWAVPKDFKDPYLKQISTIDGLDAFKEGFNYYDTSTKKGGTLTELLKEGKFTEVRGVKISSQSNERNSPQGITITLANKEGETQTVKLSPTTQSKNNGATVAFANGLMKTAKYYSNLNLNDAGNQARDNVRQGVQESFNSQDINAFSPSISKSANDIAGAQIGQNVTDPVLNLQYKKIGDRSVQVTNGQLKGTIFIYNNIEELKQKIVSGLITTGK